jgi:hypothetical protein
MYIFLAALTPARLAVQHQRLSTRCLHHAIMNAVDATGRSMARQRMTGGMDKTLTCPTHPG